MKAYDILKSCINLTMIITGKGKDSYKITYRFKKYFIKLFLN